jgi:soluble lytic murein transglycosylase
MRSPDTSAPGSGSLKLLRRACLMMSVSAAMVLAFATHAQQQSLDDEQSGVLAPTNHPVLSRDVSRLWFVPPQGAAAARAKTASADFAAALQLADKESYERALPALRKVAATPGPMGHYATYYAALADLQLGQAESARASLAALRKQPLVGFLNEAAALAEAEAAEALDDFRAAMAIYQRLSGQRTTAPESVLMRLGNAAKAAGDLKTAGEAFGRVHFEFPTSSAAVLAGTEYDALPNVQPVRAGTQRYLLELGRAERLFASRRWADAKRGFERIRPFATGDDHGLVRLRIAQCDYHMSRSRAARDGVQPYIDRGPRQAEALFYYASASRDLGAHATFVKVARRVADEFPTESWAEDALNSLGTHYILISQDAEADAVFREIANRYPSGRHAERAFWKAGWKAYRERRYADTVRYFERGAANFPRSDYRPAWLYWAGKAHLELKHASLGEQRLMLAATDYLNSYYGRLATTLLKGGTPDARVVSDEPYGLAPAPPNADVVRSLLDARRFQEALNELRYAQRVWADSAAIQATIAWTQQEQGRSETGRAQFNLLRGAITTMRRAYPQFMAAGGEQLPREVLTTIFPLSYWDLIQKHAKQRDLDPYLVAALMAQESTFVPDIRSSANAVGLMQLIPATARRYAPRVGLTYSARLLTNPDANVRMGTAYLSDKLKEFGSVHLALASYNAGETPVRRWLAERPGVPQDEFIDDIPYPETQNYVKRILGTTHDYRRLYGGLAAN